MLETSGFRNIGGLNSRVHNNLGHISPEHTFGNAVFISLLATTGSHHSRHIDHIQPSPPTYRTDSSADGLVRRLGTRYFFVLIAVAMLVIVDQVVIQPLLFRLDRFAPVINLSGRQRMLSQRLTKAALTFERAASEHIASASRRELEVTLKQWTTAHAALQDGDPMRGIKQITSPEIRHQWSQIAPHFAAMSAAAHMILDGARSSLETADASAVETIVRHEAQFLPIMDHIVKLMESEAAREVRRLRTLALGIAATIVALIGGLGWFVVWPATRTIRTQVDELETRVAARTAELTSALNSLQQEVFERQKVESKNQILATQLAHADRVESIGHLAVGLAHELNHPLGTIVNYAEACDVLLGRSDERIPRGKLAFFVCQIRDAALRAGNIVRRMRNFVQPNSSETVEMDMRMLVEEIIALCQPEIDKTQVTLRVDLGKKQLLVSVDAIQIQQVIVNLVQNALQAMGNTPVDDRHLSIRATHTFEQVRLDVIDTGPGFGGQNTEMMFEPFNSTKSDGLGVGLSICRSIIENHQGMIWAEISADGGAIVSFTLPIVPPNANCRAVPTHSICC
jgi:two-component system, LuxR family, sensor kinase FixL